MALMIVMIGVACRAVALIVVIIVIVCRAVALKGGYAPRGGSP